MHGLTAFVVLACFFTAGRVWQWRRDRHARKVARVMRDAYDTISDLSAKRRQAEEHIRFHQNDKG